MNSKTPDSLPADFISAISTILQDDQLSTDPCDCWPYGYDNSRRHTPPQIVVFPDSDRQIQEIVRECYKFSIPILPRGRGTATTGAAVPVKGGLVLSTEKLDQIISIDSDNRVAVVQPGVLNQTLQNELAKHGFFWPPDPSSQSFCTIGGNLALNAGGPMAVKYGTPRENTLGLKAVTSDGRLIKTGVMTTKGVVGLDLTRLLIGSEGTLAIITEATLKLTPLPVSQTLLVGYFKTMSAAANAVSRIMAQPITPAALEFMDENALNILREYTSVSVPENAQALLMVELDGDEAILEQQVPVIQELLETEACLNIETAEDEATASRLWSARKALSPALRKIAPKKINEDIVVPVSRIPQLIDKLNYFSQKYGIQIVNFGHAGNGNIHTNLLIDPNDPEQMEKAYTCLKEIFSLVIEFGGTLSGEHGVGIEKQPFVPMEIDPTTLELMRNIKKAFDPRNILNPDKVFPIE